MKPKYSLEELLPHRAPMLLLDEVVDVSKTHAIAAVMPGNHKANLFSSTGNYETPQWVAIEYMAQTAALISGYMCRTVNIGPELAFLLGTREIKFSSDYLPANKKLTISATLNMFDKDSGLALFDSTVSAEGKELIAASLKAMLPTDTKQFLEELKKNEQ